jgi:hypothetical protein
LARLPAVGPEVEMTLERAVSQLRHCEPIGFERMSEYATADLAYDRPEEPELHHVVAAALPGPLPAVYRLIGGPSDYACHDRMGRSTEKEETMNWSKIIRRFVAIVVASALGAGLMAAFVDESAGWSDNVGFGLFLMAIGVGTVTMTFCHRVQTSR